MILSRFNRKEFAINVEMYLPSIEFDECIFDEVCQWIRDAHPPKCIHLDGTALDPSAYNIFYGMFGLKELHAAFRTKEFDDIIFDYDLRKQIDGMAMSSVFRRIDIVREFGNINSMIIDVYLDCIANYKELKSKASFIARYINDEYDKALFTKIIETTSRKHLQIVLGLKTQTVAPMAIMEKSLNIAAMKTDIALLGNNPGELEKWIKLQVGVAEKLHNMGAGTQSDLDRLIDLLKAEPTYDDPVIYTKEMLDEKQ